MSGQTDAVKRYFKAYENKDRATIEPLLAAGFTFSSPQDDRIGRDAYFRDCWPNAHSIRSFDLERVVENDDEVVVRYVLEMQDGRWMRNMELFRFEGGQIVEVDVYFGRNVEEVQP
ncbi:MAG: nuclear transport factor 2 family protein [Oceanicaulis sp.]|uniref:nuclear transport factor 2 family protein n=1 Tax=Glycocaulis sp. TaxID=1969725 RepID=UPI0025C2DBB4|nr:nuclear transport factor 2 family protein [Glycocaulis sp.]MCC5980298.1 nuclear transport factor 2 family protein [Oceanicaulis sp.]MCH8521682.1 nuclear transport factor 2 family protein [Glycocaulis sp.]